MIFVVPLSIVVLKNEPKILLKSNDSGSEVSESSKNQVLFGLINGPQLIIQNQCGNFL